MLVLVLVPVPVRAFARLLVTLAATWLTYPNLPTYLPTYIFTFLPIPARPPARLPVYLSACLPAYLLEVARLALLDLACLISIFTPPCAYFLPVPHPQKNSALLCLSVRYR